MKILKIKEQKDGSAIMTYQLNAREIECFKTAARIKHKKFCKAFINKCMLEAIEHEIQREENKHGGC